MNKKQLLFLFTCIGLLVVLLLYSPSIALTSKKEVSLQPPQVVINEVMSNNRNLIRDPDGDFESWIELYNTGDTPVNLQGFGLSDDPSIPFLFTLPDIELDPHSFLIIWVSGKNTYSPKAIHTNFKLSSKDKILLLTNPSTSAQDLFPLESPLENISYGRLPDGDKHIAGFDQGSPKQLNSKHTPLLEPIPHRLKQPIVSHESGFYTTPITLTLDTPTDGTKIYFTLDGSEPTEAATLYTSPLTLSFHDEAPTIFRARAYKEGYPASPIVSHTFFISSKVTEHYDLPIVSLITDPANLFDSKIGIYTPGKIFENWIANHPNETPTADTPANYNQRGKSWERPAYIEYFTPTGELKLQQSIGIRISGGFSRSQPIKSLALHANLSYDDSDTFTYNFFEPYSDTAPSSVLLRCSGNDYKSTLFRDAFVQSLIPPELHLDTQDSSPCIVFINGDYYGIHNLRETYTKDTLAQTYDMNPEDVVILKNPNGINPLNIDEGFAGDEMHYNRMINYLNTSPPNTPESYDFISTQIDLSNFIDYTILQIYSANGDWPGNNLRVWRKRTPTYIPDAPYGHDGRWRWLVFDLDYSFSLYTKANYTINSLAHATATNGPDWPNPPWSTFLLRSLLMNEDFKIQFINTFADRLNTIFSPETVIPKLNAFESLYETSIPRHLSRWNLHHQNPDNWYAEVEKMRIFATHRPTYIRQHLLEYFDLKDTYSLSLTVQQGGSVKLNTLLHSPSDSPWEGLYFSGIPITLEAIPDPGYSFSGWKGDCTLPTSKVSLSPTSPLTLEATFIAHSP